MNKQRGQQVVLASHNKKWLSHPLTKLRKKIYCSFVGLRGLAFFPLLGLTFWYQMVQNFKRGQCQNWLF